MNRKLLLFTILFLSLVMISPVIAEVSITNDYYVIYVDDSDGTFSVGTGVSHPHPDESVLYGGGWGYAGTSWFTIKFYSLYGEEYDTDDLIDYIQPIVVDTTSMTETWIVDDLFDMGSTDQGTLEIPGFIITRTFTLNGDSYVSSYIDIVTTFANNTTETVSFGFLDRWDLEIADADDAIMRTINSTSSWSGNFQGWYPPTFTALEVTDVLPPANTFSIFIPLVSDEIELTIPDEFIYGEWSESGYWGYVPSGGYTDSAVAFIYGASEEEQITLAPGESIQIVQGITTNAQSLDIIVPTNNISVGAFIPLYKVKLVQALEMWNCILAQLPEEVPEDVATLIESVQSFMNGAITLSNPIYANGQLSKAIEQMGLIQDSFDIDCIK